MKVYCIHETLRIKMNLKVHCINDTPCIKMNLKVYCIHNTSCIKMYLKVYWIKMNLNVLCTVYIHDTPCIKMNLRCTVSRWTWRCATRYILYQDELEGVLYTWYILYQDELEGVLYTRIDIDFLTTYMLYRGSKPSIWQSGTVGLTRLRNSGIINLVKNHIFCTLKLNITLLIGCRLNTISWIL